MFSSPKIAQRLLLFASAGMVLLSGCANTDWGRLRGRRWVDCDGCVIPGCFGFHSTCWRPWPEECVTCPSPYAPDSAPRELLQSKADDRTPNAVAEVRVDETPLPRLLPSAPSTLSSNRRTAIVQPKPVSYPVVEVPTAVPVPARAPLPGDLPNFYGGR